MAIFGPSGSGKSTLLHILGLLDKPTEGKVLFKGKDVSLLDEDKLAEIRLNEIGFVFQAFNLIPSLTALENVELPLMIKGVPRQKRRKRAEELLKALSIYERRLHKPNELSGGQKQRVAIARALALSPSLILADEPTGNLDSKSGKEVLDIFSSLNKKGNTLVVVTHDKEVAKRASRIVHIKDGKIVREEKEKVKKEKPNL